MFETEGPRFLFDSYHVRGVAGKPEIRFCPMVGICSFQTHTICGIGPPSNSPSAGEPFNPYDTGYVDSWYARIDDSGVLTTLPHTGGMVGPTVAPATGYPPVTSGGDGYSVPGNDRHLTFLTNYDIAGGFTYTRST
jgi:hypothetical protein